MTINVKPTFVLLTGKESGLPISINVSDIFAYNSDVDGVGTLIISSGGVVRTVTETPEEVTAAIEC